MVPSKFKFLMTIVAVCLTFDFAYAPHKKDLVTRHIECIKSIAYVFKYEFKKDLSKEYRGDELTKKMCFELAINKLSQKHMEENYTRRQVPLETERKKYIPTPLEVLSEHGVTYHSLILRYIDCTKILNTEVFCLEKAMEAGENGIPDKSTEKLCLRELEKIKFVGSPYTITKKLLDDEVYLEDYLGKQYFFGVLYIEHVIANINFFEGIEDPNEHCLKNCTHESSSDEEEYEEKGESSSK